MADVPPPLRVVEWGRGIAAGYAAKMLGTIGASTSRVVDPGADCDPHRDGSAAVASYLDAGKTVHPLDLRHAAERQRFLSLLGDADILIEDQAPGYTSDCRLDRTDLWAANPNLTIVSVTPFGTSGPYRDYRGNDAVVSFMAGLAYLTPRDIEREGDGARQPPLKMPGSLVSIYAGISAAGAALTALRLREQTGRGHHVDVSMLESLIPTLRREIALCEYEGVVATRFMRVWRLAPWGVKRCRDGFVFLQVVEKHHWQGLVEMMGSPGWARDERYDESDFRYEHRREIEERLRPWLSAHTRAEIEGEAQRRAVPFVGVNALADLAGIPQLAHRGFFARDPRAEGRVVPGPPWRLTRTAGDGSMRDAVDRGTRQPLAGIRVVDFGHVWAGPYCAATLADMGAEVVKVESDRRLDVHRRQGPYPERRPGRDRSGVWNAQNRNKKSVAIDLGTAAGREQALGLVAASDVVVENFAPGVMRRLGLDYDSLRRVKPDIVMVSLSACGQEGPQCHYVGYGPALDAWSGLCGETAYPGAPPMSLGGVFPDTGSALHGVLAVLGALRDRDRTGSACHIDISELEVSILLLADLLLRSQDREPPATEGGNADPYAFPQNAYRCQGEDRWILLSVVDDAAWRGLCVVLGREDWAQDALFGSAEGRRAQAREIDAEIRRWAAGSDADDAFHELQAHGVPAGPANTIPDLLKDPHLRERGAFVEVVHPAAGRQTVYAPIWCIDGERPTLRAAPLLGADTDRILTTIPPAARVVRDRR